MTIRTITVGIAEPHPLGDDTLARAAGILARGRAAAEAAGSTVQTVRIATRPLLVDLAAWDDAAILEYAQTVQSRCDAHGIAYCSLGPAPADDPVFPVERIALLPRILAPRPTLNATVQLASREHGVRWEALVPAARAMRALGEHEAGEANFRFAALACCDPGGPFFPQAYHLAPTWTLSVGLQSADLVRQSIEALVDREGPGLPALRLLSAAVAGTLTEAATPIVALVADAAREMGCQFGGIDLSPAPMGDVSIAGAIEAVGLGLFGEPGTLAVSAALTAAIKSVHLPTCGYCGLMLPVLEDQTIGERCATGALSVTSLLAYSAVCGTGLDTVPIPGETPVERVGALLADVASLAVRLNKPLSARLFLVPGAAAGDFTNFASPYLTNTRVLPV